MQRETGTFTVKSGLAEMLKGGVIMDVTTAEQAKIAEDAGACAVMALERVPADIRRDGGVARMADPTKIEEIQAGRHDPGDGEGAHRALRRGADPAVARRRLHRRVRGADAGRRGSTTSTSGRSRCRSSAGAAEPRRGAAPHRRGRGDDPHEGRGGHRQRRRGRAPHARDPPRDRRVHDRCARSST